MKKIALFLILISLFVVGCTKPAKVRSLSNTSGKLPATEPISAEQQQAFKFATQHGDETVFQYGYGSKTAFFKTSQYCYSAKEDAMKFLSNDGASIITVPLEDVQACLGGTKIVKKRSAGKVFSDHLVGGAVGGAQLGLDVTVGLAEEELHDNFGLAVLGFLMTPVGVVVGATVGTVLGGTVGLFAMGINSAIDQGTRVCREYYDEDSEEEFLMSHLCYDD